MTTTKGFTLIELLIVIGILAILATTVVLVLNPAQILQETRDTQRISDLGTVNSAIGLYLATVSSPGLGGIDNTVCAIGGLTAARISSPSGTIAATQQPFVTPDSAAIPASPTNARAVDGSGWVSVDLANTSGGAPLSALPVDPTNAVNTATLALDGNTGTLNYYYAYQCSGTTYEINANMESTKFSSGTTGVEDKDGGTRSCSDTGLASARCDPAAGPATKANQVYEVGNAPLLAL